MNFDVNSSYKILKINKAKPANNTIIVYLQHIKSILVLLLVLYYTQWNVYATDLDKLYL